MHVYFTASESTFSYFEATRAYLERYGKPVALYSDKASVFRSTAPPWEKIKLPCCLESHQYPTSNPLTYSDSSAHRRLRA